MVEGKETAVSTLVSPPLVAGQKLTREEFLRRWEAMPELKHAELIGGLVYMPSPVSLPHASHTSLVIAWLVNYAVRTPGCRSANSCTWWMLEDAPQPDADLCILPMYGGQSRQQGIYSAGAPELAAEVCLSTADYDLGPKLELFQAAGVQEYVAVLLAEPRVLWQRLMGGRYAPLQPGPDGILRSVVFPGLWLDPAALLAENGARVLEVLDQGVSSKEHRDFVVGLARRKHSS
jgi:hypothetical protein